MKKFLAMMLCIVMLMSCSAALADSFFFTTYKGSYVQATAQVYVRSGPGLAYQALDDLKKDEILPYCYETSYDSRGVAWYKVFYENDFAWVSSKYSTLHNNMIFATPDTYVRATASVNLRKGPGVSYQDIGTLARGEQVLYLDQSAKDTKGNVWYKVKYYTMGEGWVCGLYAELVTGTSAGVAETETVVTGTYVEATDGKSNLRKGPGLTYDDVETMQVGEIATYLGAYATDERGVLWYYVRFEGQVGWVSSRYATLY